MGLVIKFPYKEEIFPLNSKKYLELCKKELIRDDYEEFLCCVLDKDMYNDADEDIQNLVDAYLQYLE